MSAVKPTGLTSGVLDKSGRCTGAYDCHAFRHVHGCYADKGQCDDPGDHR